MSQASKLDELANILEKCVSEETKVKNPDHKTPPPSPCPEYSFDSKYETIPEFPDVETLEIPLVRETGIRGCIEKISSFFNCENYKSNMIQYWFLDVITDCIWMCQDKFHFPNNVTRVVLSWVIFAFDIIRDRSKNPSKREFLRIIRETLFVASDLIEEGFYEVPIPVRLVKILSNDEILEDAVTLEHETDESCKTCLHCSTTTDNDYSSYVEIHGNEIMIHPLAHEICGCSQSASTDSLTLKTDVTSGTTCEIKKDEFDFYDLYKEDLATPPRFKSLTGLQIQDKDKNIKDSITTEKNLDDQSKTNQTDTVESEKFLIEIDGEKSNPNITGDEAIYEKAFVIFRRPSWVSVESDLESESDLTKHLTLKTHRRSTGRSKRSSVKKSREGKKSVHRSKTNMKHSKSKSKSKLDDSKTGHLNSGTSIRSRRSTNQDRGDTQSKIMEGLKLYKMWEQRVRDLQNSQIGLDSWQMGKLKPKDEKEKRDTLVFENEEQEDDYLDDILDEELIDLLKKQDVHELDKKEFLSFGVLWAIIDFIYSYFSDPFQYLLIKIALTAQPTIITQTLNEDWWVPKDLKENLTVYVKDLADKDKRFPVKKPKPKKVKEPKVKKEKPEKVPKVKPEKPPKLTKEEKEVLKQQEKLKKKLAEEEAARKLKEEEDKIFLFPLQDADLDDEFFKSKFKNFKRINLKKKGGKKK